MSLRDGSHQKLRNCVYICQSYAEKTVASFFRIRCRLTRRCTCINPVIADTIIGHPKLASIRLYLLILSLTFRPLGLKFITVVWQAARPRHNHNVNELTLPYLLWQNWAISATVLKMAAFSHFYRNCSFRGCMECTFVSLYHSRR